MRAVLVSDTATADILQVADVEKPSPGPGQVHVTLAAAIRPVDGGGRRR